MHTAKTHALEVAAERASDGLTERSLANTRRSDKAEDRRLRVRVHLQNAKVFEDALLYFLQAEVIVIEHLTRMRDVEIVLRVNVPRQLEHQVDVAPNHVVLGRRTR